MYLRIKTFPANMKLWKIELCYTALFCDWLRAYTKIATSLDVQVNYNTCLKIIFILSLEQHKQM